MLTSASRSGFPFFVVHQVARASLGGLGGHRHNRCVQYITSSFDPYQVLGVSPGASADEIKSQYRELAKRYHPDRNRGDDSKFKEVQRAYETLTKGDERSSSSSSSSSIYNSRGPQNRAADEADWSGAEYRFHGDPFQFFYAQQQQAYNTNNNDWQRNYAGFHSEERVDPNTGYYVRWQTYSRPGSAFFYTTKTGSQSHGQGSNAGSSNFGNTFRQFFHQQQQQHQSRRRQAEETWSNQTWTSTPFSSNSTTTQNPFFTNWWGQFGLRESDAQRMERAYRAFRRRQLLAQFLLAFVLFCAMMFPFWCIYWFVKICAAIVTGLVKLITG